MAPAQPPQLVLEILSNGGRLDRKVYSQELTRLQLEEFLQSCPEFERMVVRSGIVLLNYWFSVSDAEQESRFQSLINESPYQVGESLAVKARKPEASQLVGAPQEGQ
jgi:hypothetical protein